MAKTKTLPRIEEHQWVSARPKRPHAAETSEVAKSGSNKLTPDYQFEFGDEISFGDLRVSEDVDPEILKTMKYRLDVTNNDTALRHRIFSDRPIEKRDTRYGTAVKVSGKSVIIHDSTDHAPSWLAAGIYVCNTALEYEPWTGRTVAVFD